MNYIGTWTVFPRKRLSGMLSTVALYGKVMQTQRFDRDSSDVIGMLSCIFLIRRQVIVRLVVLLWMKRFLFCYRDGRPRRRLAALRVPATTGGGPCGDAED